jgi:hypothetical protein
MNYDLLSLCCMGDHCLRHPSSSKVVFEFIPGRRTEKEVIIWLRLGRHDAFRDLLERPEWCEDTHFNLVKREYK